MDGTAKIAEKENYLPQPPSPAVVNPDADQYANHARNAFSQALVLIESAADHIWAMTGMFEPPSTVIAPCTCARAAIEAAATAAWLVDSKVSREDVVARSLALRYAEVQEQVKFARAAAPNSSSLDPLAKRHTHIVDLAISFGLMPVLDRKGRVAGAGTRIPNATQMIRDVLDQEVDYRLMSAVAHGQGWAIRQLCFREKQSARSAANAHGFGAGFEKSVNPRVVQYLSLQTARAFAFAFWSFAGLAGWNRAQLIPVFETCFDQIGAADTVRFWR